MTLVLLGAFTGTNGWITSALGIISLATFAGLGIGLGRIKDLRDRLADARADVAALRADQAAYKDHMAEQDIIIAKQRADIQTLQAVVTREVEWHVLTDQVQEQTKRLDDHHAEAKAYWNASKDRWESAEAKVDAIVEFLRDQAGSP